MNIPSESEIKALLDLNEFIHNGTKLFEYHMEHIDLVRRYAMILNKRLSADLDVHKIEYISIAHDLFKERSLNQKRPSVTWRAYQVPQDINRYVRLNLNILEKYELDEYFNTDIQLHPQAAAIFLIKEFGIEDKEIIYPIIFHSCPIIPVYEKLDPNVQTMVDVIMLADKLSSNVLKISSGNLKTRVDLDRIVFGMKGNEFNYTLGLFICRLLSQGNSREKNSIITSDYYHKRLVETNPLISKKNNYSIRKLGGVKSWPPRQIGIKN